MRSLAGGFQRLELQGQLEVIFGVLYVRHGCVLVEHDERERFVVVGVRS